MNYFLIKYSKKVYIYKYDAPECQEIILDETGVRQINSYKVNKLKYAFPVKTEKFYEVSHHIFDICKYSRENNTFLPFNPEEIKSFLRKDLKKRYPESKIERVTTWYINTI